MKVNEGSLDRLIRLLAAGVLIGIGLGVLRGPGGIAMAAVGVIPLLTGVTGFCPLYTVFGIDTSRRSSS
ncbi:MAG: DUF2892 domain-containing protein [Dehalococcoidia bacterium]